MKPLFRTLSAGVCLAVAFWLAALPSNAQDSSSNATAGRLQSIVISLNFTDATIESATRFLTGESKRLDPGHQGINFVFQPGALKDAKLVTLRLDNVPMSEALRYICQLAKVKYKVREYAVTILPYSADGNELVTRSFSVGPDFVAPPSNSKPQPAGL